MPVDPPPDGGSPNADPVEQWSAVVRRVHDAQQRVLADVAATGVPPQWFPVLALLLAEPSHKLPMSAIARDVSMTSGGFTKLADRLAREGLIDRRGTSGDRRVVHAVLTKRGQRLARLAVQTYADAVQAHVLQGLSAADINSLVGVVDRLPATIESTAGEDTGEVISNDADAEPTTGNDEPAEPAAGTAQFLIDERPPTSPDRRRRRPAP